MVVIFSKSAQSFRFTTEAVHKNHESIHLRTFTSRKTHPYPSLPFFTPCLAAILSSHTLTFENFSSNTSSSIPDCLWPDTHGYALISAQEYFPVPRPARYSRGGVEVNDPGVVEMRISEWDREAQNGKSTGKTSFQDSVQPQSLILVSLDRVGDLFRCVEVKMIQLATHRSHAPVP